MDRLVRKIEIPLAKNAIEEAGLYIVQKNTWHHLQVSEDAFIVVVENGDTSKTNTESKAVKG